MIEIIAFDNFSKRKNSTKQPVDSEGTVMQVALKGECSLVNPSFFISGTQGWNYIKFNGLYYFVDRVAYDINGAQYINCSIDVLASWKPSILSTSAFVNYSSTDYSTKLRDDRVGIMAEMDSTSVEDTSEYFEPNDNPAILVTVVGEDLGLSTFIIRERYFNEIFMSCLLPDGVSSWWENLELQFGDAFGSILSARRIACDPTALAYDFPDEEDPPRVLKLGSYEPIFVGPEGQTLIFPRLTNSHIAELKTITIPWHYTDFRQLEPYQKLLVSLPFVGEIQLAISDFICGNDITIRMDCDVITGAVAYTIRNSDNRIVGVYNGVMGGDVPVASHQVQNQRQIVEGLGAASVMALGMETVTIPIESKTVGATLALASKAFVNSHQHTTSIIGGYSGAWGEFALAKYIVTIQWYPTRIEPSTLAELYGRPCGKVRKIEGLTGYVETDNFAIDIPAVSEIRDLINSAMDRGVYIE